jgi:hypothetical protein
MVFPGWGNPEKQALAGAVVAVVELVAEVIEGSAPGFRSLVSGVVVTVEGDDEGFAWGRVEDAQELGDGRRAREVGVGRNLLGFAVGGVEGSFRHVGSTPLEAHHTPVCRGCATRCSSCAYHQIRRVCVFVLLIS